MSEVVTVDDGALVSVMDSQAVVSSQSIAKKFEKRHDRVLRAIDDAKDGIPNFGEMFSETSLPDSYGRFHRAYLMNRDGFCLIAMGFTGKEAMKWKLKYIKAFDGMEQALQSKAIEQAIAAAKDERLDRIENMLVSSGIFDVFTNPRYSFYQYRYFYVTTTGDDSPRGFYDSIADYTGIVVPMGYNIKGTVIEWIINNIPMDYIKEFALGVKAGSIVRSDAGHWVNLNGFDSKSGVEWEKTKRFFGNRCAYCGEEAPLVPEHIVPQTVMSTVDPRRVDLVGSNVICSCSRCNGEKGTNNMEDWFRHSKQFSEYRLGRIHEFQRMYGISVLPE